MTLVYATRIYTAIKNYRELRFEKLMDRIRIDYNLPIPMFQTTHPLYHKGVSELIFYDMLDILRESIENELIRHISPALW